MAITKEQVKSWRESKRELLAAVAVMPTPSAAAPSTANDGNRTVDICWFTGTPIPRIDWWTGDVYTMLFDPEGCDLSLLNAGAPILDHHMTYDGASESQKGKVERAWVDGESYLATIRFSKRPEVDGLWGDVRDGIVTKFSMGVELLETIEQRDATGKLTVKTAKKWRPFEISCEPIPADFGTTTLSMHEQNPPVEIPPADAGATAQLKKEVPTMEPVLNPAGGEARVTEEQLKSAREEGARLEREKQQQELARRSGIDEACATFLKRGDVDTAFVESMKQAGKTVEQVKSAIVDHLAKRTDKDPISGSHATNLGGQDVREKRREAMTMALLHRHDGSTKLEGEAREYRGMSLMRMAEECLAQAGVKTRGMSPMELATVALSFGQQFTGIGGDGVERLGAMSTSDFPYILANVANKRLRAAYEAQSSMWKEFCNQSNASDFKAKYVTQLGDAPDLDKVNEGGEFKYGKVPEARESYSLLTYGKILPFTRQSLINDDMGAFARLQELQGRAAARKEADVIWALITANAAMGDTGLLFNATAVTTAGGHANYISSGTVINVDNLGIARQKMRVQKGLSNTEYLNLVPKYLLVPTAKEQVAMQYTSTAYQAMATTGTATGLNPWAGSLKPIAEARLDANSATAWYLVADPAQIDTIEYAYLEGQEGVYLETRMGFNVDGMEFKSRLDFGAKVIDWRAFVKNAGA